MKSDVLEELWDVIGRRMEEKPEGSYVVSILTHRKGVDKSLEKVGEEATEFILAMKNDNYERKVEESADLIFHLLLSLRAGDVRLEDVMDELASRRR